MPVFLTFLLGPIGRWLIGVALVMAALAGMYFKVKQIGWNERDTIAKEERLEADRRIAELKRKQQEVSERVVVKYRDRVQIVREQGEEVIREVEKFVPIDSCHLPGGWRLLHDAAALGLSIPPEGTDATPVPAQDAARTVGENYSICRQDQERLRALQEWVSSQNTISGKE